MLTNNEANTMNKKTKEDTRSALETAKAHIDNALDWLKDESPHYTLSDCIGEAQSYLSAADEAQ